MFETGNLLFFRPFIFKNGAEPQDKFMVVLGLDTNGNMVLASLPTSKDHVPSDIDVESDVLICLKDKLMYLFLKKVNVLLNRMG